MNFHMLYAWHRAPHNALARAIPAILASITRLEPAPPIVARFAHRHTEDPVPFTTVPDATQRFETNHACLFRAGPDPDRPEVEFILTPVGWTQQFEHDPSWAESGGLTAHLNARPSCPSPATATSTPTTPPTCTGWRPWWPGSHSSTHGVPSVPLKEHDRQVRPHPIRRSSPATRDTS